MDFSSWTSVLYSLVKPMTGFASEHLLPWLVLNILRQVVCHFTHSGCCLFRFVSASMYSSGDEPAVMSCGPGSQRPYQSSVTATTRSWHGDPAVTWSNQPNAGTIVFANPHGSMQFNMPR